ncbi:arsenate reductase family protein [Clostridiaceae bacterium 35-E11]
MKYLFIHYPKCSTCKRAKQWLENNGINFKARSIVEDNPTKEELETWYHKSDLPLRKFFNTSGILYREMKLKDVVQTASEDELLDLLSSNGMLVKRPVIVADDFILLGFKEKDWEEKLKA